jgi:hypothetical protein
MSTASPQCARFARHLLALASFALLAGCIDSAAPILTDAQPRLGLAPHLQFYALHDGAAHDPSEETFNWRDSRYVPVKGSADDMGEFTLHDFENGDLIVQNVRSGHPAEYAIARKLADGAYLVIAIDENDADAATRSKYCSTDGGHACRVTTGEAILALARATAAKPHARGGLAVLLAAD